MIWRVCFLLFMAQDVVFSAGIKLREEDMWDGVCVPNGQQCMSKISCCNGLSCQFDGHMNLCLPPDSENDRCISNGQQCNYYIKCCGGLSCQFDGHMNVCLPKTSGIESTKSDDANVVAAAVSGEQAGVNEAAAVSGEQINCGLDNWNCDENKVCCVGYNCATNKQTGQSVCVQGDGSSPYNYGLQCGGQDFECDENNLCCVGFMCETTSTGAKMCTNGTNNYHQDTMEDGNCGKQNWNCDENNPCCVGYNCETTATGMKMCSPSGNSPPLDQEFTYNPMDTAYCAKDTWRCDASTPCCSGLVCDRRVVNGMETRVCVRRTYHQELLEEGRADKVGSPYCGKEDWRCDERSPCCAPLICNPEGNDAVCRKKPEDPVTPPPYPFTTPPYVLVAKKKKHTDSDKSSSSSWSDWLDKAKKMADPSTWSGSAPATLLAAKSGKKKKSDDEKDDSSSWNKWINGNGDNSWDKWINGKGKGDKDKDESTCGQLNWPCYDIECCAGLHCKTKKNGFQTEKICAKNKKPNPSPKPLLELRAANCSIKDAKCNDQFVCCGGLVCIPNAGNGSNGYCSTLPSHLSAGAKDQSKDSSWDHWINGGNDNKSDSNNSWDKWSNSSSWDKWSNGSFPHQLLALFKKEGGNFWDKWLGGSDNSDENGNSAAMWDQSSDGNTTWEKWTTGNATWEKWTDGNTTWEKWTNGNQTWDKWMNGNKTWSSQGAEGGNDGGNVCGKESWPCYDIDCCDGLECTVKASGGYGEVHTCSKKKEVNNKLTSSSGDDPLNCVPINKECDNSLPCCVELECYPLHEGNGSFCRPQHNLIQQIQQQTGPDYCGLLDYPCTKTDDCCDGLSCKRNRQQGAYNQTCQAPVTEMPVTDMPDMPDVDGLDCKEEGHECEVDSHLLGSERCCDDLVCVRSPYGDGGRVCIQEQPAHDINQIQMVDDSPVCAQLNWTCHDMFFPCCEDMSCEEVKVGKKKKHKCKANKVKKHKGVSKQSNKLFQLLYLRTRN